MFPYADADIKDRTWFSVSSTLKEFLDLPFEAAEAFQVYVSIDKDKSNLISWAACWAHGRRKFIEAQYCDHAFKDAVLKMIRNLFRYEKVAWKHKAEVRLKIRRELELPIVDKLFKTLREKITTEVMLPKAKITEAVKYMLRYEENFRRYLSDPNLRIDNNEAERAIRKVVRSKKNWMFDGSPNAGKSMAILYSFVQTCRELKINPQEYLEDVFRRLYNHPHKSLRELLPDQWLKDKQTKNQTSN